MPPRGAEAENGSSAPTGLHRQAALAAAQALVESAIYDRSVGSVIALEELLTGRVAALEERHAAAIFALIVRAGGRLPPFLLPPPFCYVPTRGEFPAGAEGLEEFRNAAFEFVLQEVVGEAGPAGARAPMAVPAAQRFVQVCMATCF